MNTKIVGISIAAFIGIVVLASVLMPILDDATATTDKFTNDGNYEITYTQTDNITLIWDHTSPSSVSINGESITTPTLSNGEQRTILCGDDWIIRLGYGTSLGGYYIQWYPSSGASILASQANELDLTVTCASGSVSVTDTASTPNTATGTYTYLYCIADDGAFVMKNATDSVYMLADSEFYAMGLTNVGTFTSTGIKIIGTIEDGATWATFRGTDFTFSNEEMVYEEVSGYKGLYKLTSMSATVTKEDQSTTATYSYFIVPAEITAEKAEHMTNGQIQLLEVIPVLIIVAILLAVIALVIRSRME